MAEDAMNARQGELASANARQHGGDHYKGATYEHWDWVTDCSMSYLAGTASKYIFRWRKKNGIEDLKKAVHYMDKIREKNPAVGLAGPRAYHGDDGVDRQALESYWRFINANNVPMREASILFNLMIGEWGAARLQAAELLAESRSKIVVE